MTDSPVFTLVNPTIGEDKPDKEEIFAR